MFPLEQPEKTAELVKKIAQQKVFEDRRRIQCVRIESLNIQHLANLLLHPDDARLLKSCES